MHNYLMFAKEKDQPMLAKQKQSVPLTHKRTYYPCLIPFGSYHRSFDIVGACCTN